MWYEILDKIFGEEVQHIVTYDSALKPLEGNKNYRLHLSSDIPVRNHRSVIVYDSKTRLVIKNDQKRPSVNSSCMNLVKNPDGTIDLWFGPKAPAGKVCNWLQSDPKKKWYMILHLYGPSESWYNKSCSPGEIEEVV